MLDHPLALALPRLPLVHAAARRPLPRLYTRPRQLSNPAMDPSWCIFQHGPRLPHAQLDIDRPLPRLRVRPCKRAARQLATRAQLVPAWAASRPRARPWCAWVAGRPSAVCISGPCRRTTLRRCG